MKIAFYKGTRPGLAAIYSIGVQIWTKSPYSHCEIVFSDGMSASSSFEDGGVRFKKIEFTPGHWDFIELPDYLEAGARKWFEEHTGLKYDILGNIHFLLGPVKDGKKRWFCSEAVGASLGLRESWRYSPGSLFSTVQFLRDQADYWQNK